MTLLCFIFGHSWTEFYAEQCPMIYRACKRCRSVEHVCNKGDQG